MLTFKQFVLEALDVSDNPNFWKWFGKSKVVDTQGNPLICFHTSVADVNKFKRSGTDIGMHFGTKGQAADRYHLKNERDPYGPTLRDVKHNTLAVFLRIVKPLRLPDEGSWERHNVLYALDELPEFKGKVNSSMRLSDLRSVIQAHGYDGIVYANTGETHGGEVYRKRKDDAWNEMRKVFPNQTGFTPEDQKHPAYVAYRKAFDAYTHFRESNAEDSWIVFDPKQIKSALGNNGNFNPRDPDITH